MSGSRGKCLETIRARECERWIGRSLDGMDEEMIGTMWLDSEQDRLKRGDNLLGAFRRVYHQRSTAATGGRSIRLSGIESGGVEVVGMLCDQSGHRFGVAFALHFEVVIGVLRIACGQRVDVVVSIAGPPAASCCAFDIASKACFSRALPMSMSL